MNEKQKVENLSENNTSSFAELTIGISISESQDIAERGFGDMHLQDSMVEFARYLLGTGASLAYGGDLRAKGFTDILFDLVHTNKQSNKSSLKRIISYLAWPIHLNLSSSHKAALKGVADFRPLEPPAYLNLDKTKYIKPDSPENLYIWAHSLTVMREEMNRSIHARLLMGGKVTGYTGKYPGLAEEAYLALRDEKPLFLIGGLGGCTNAIIEALTGKTPKALTQEGQTAENSDYQQFISYYNSHLDIVPENNLEPIDYDKLLSFFQQKGIQGLKNGLSKEDNKRLFQTIHLPEMIALVLKGLKQLYAC